MRFPRTAVSLRSSARERKDFIAPYIYFARRRRDIGLRVLHARARTEFPRVTRDWCSYTPPPGSTETRNDNEILVGIRSGRRVSRLRLFRFTFRGKLGHSVASARTHRRIPSSIHRATPRERVSRYCDLNNKLYVLTRTNCG